MPTQRSATGLVLGLATVLAGGCDLAFEPDATGEQLRLAMDEVVLTGEAQGLEDGIVEITTSFTLGQGLESVLDEVRSFTRSQVPCSTVDSPEPGVLVIDFGELEDACVYRGKTYAGVATVHFELAADGVVVEHTYEGITNGHVTLDGAATVTWRGRSRRVETDLAFTGLDGATLEVTSDRTQTPIGSIGEGVRVDGTRDWTSAHGTWALDIEGVELRAADPVPQAGTYQLSTPDEHELRLSFDRVDAETIEVTVEGGRREHVFRVTSAGDVSE